jgi:hypothetical protein
MTALLRTFLQPWSAGTASGYRSSVPVYRSSRVCKEELSYLISPQARFPASRSLLAITNSSTFECRRFATALARFSTNALCLYRNWSWRSWLPPSPGDTRTHWYGHLMQWASWSVVGLRLRWLLWWRWTLDGSVNACTDTDMQCLAISVPWLCRHKRFRKAEPSWPLSRDVYQKISVTVGNRNPSRLLRMKSL